jgi:zinc protease
VKCTLLLAWSLFCWTASAAVAGDPKAEPPVADSATGGLVPATQVVRLPVPSDPTVSFRILFNTGSQDDPPGKEGLAAITASMLSEGSTRKHSYGKILDLLFPLAGGYGSNVSVETTVVAGRIHKDNLTAYYPILTEALLEPAFEQPDLDRLKSQTLNSLENTLRYASDEELGKAVLYTTIFAGTPYGHIPEGLIQSVRNIQLDDVRKFYQRHYTRRNVVLGIGGCYDEALVSKLCADLGRLPSGNPAAAPPPSPKPIDGMHVTIVEKKDIPATTISIGFPIDVLRGQKPWYALAVANSWLGEHRNPASHLYQVIRESRGLNYGDYSYIENFPNAGARQMPPANVGRRRQIFEIWVRPVPNDARLFAFRAAIRELKRLSSEGITQSEFEAARNFLGKYVMHYAETTMDRLGYALDDRFYGVPGSHLEIFRERLAGMTREEVNQAVAQYLPYGNMEIVFVTDSAQALKDALVHDTPSPIKYPTPKPPAILEEDEKIAAFPISVKAENVRIVPVEQLFVK